MRRPRAWVALACVALSSLAAGQQAPDAGQVLREQLPAVPLLPPARSLPPLGVDEGSPPAGGAASSMRLRVHGWRIRGATVFPSDTLTALLGDPAGRELGLGELREAAARVTRLYREQGYPLARAFLPVQEIRDGLVEIAVSEGIVGQVNLINRARVDEATALAHLSGLAGRPVFQPELERRLLLLGDLAGVGEPRAAVRAGGRAGESDLDVALAPDPAATGTFELDNHGSRYTGAVRLGAELRWASPTGAGDRLDLRVTHGVSRLSHGRLGYQRPIGADGWRATASVARTRYELGKDFEALEADGEAHVAQAGLSHAAVRSLAFNLTLQFGIEHQRLEDRVGATASVNRKRLRVLRMGLSADLSHAGGISAVTWSLAEGRLDIDSPDAAATDAATARTQGRYRRLSAAFVRMQPLGAASGLVLAISGQAASRNLDSSEKFALGGPQGVRGYPTGEASGDSGYLASVEWRTTLALASGQWQPFAFVDRGEVTVNRRPYSVAPNRMSLQSAGLGLAWSLPGGSQLKLTWARRGETPARADTDARSRVWVLCRQSL